MSQTAEPLVTTACACKKCVDCQMHQLVAASASHHGRLYFNNRDSMGESTGHGAPLPHMVHGGPGRAGGGEELGGLRGLEPYMQRVALQGNRALLDKLFS